jgi:8-oxo-dGTP pyrophosphatase MutT (NUDIX family)
VGVSTGLDGVSSDYLHYVSYRDSLRELQRQGGQSGAYSPGVPMRPIDGVGGVPRSWDFPAGYNIRTRAEREGRISFATMKKITDTYEIARICIQHRIDGVRSLNWQIVPEIGYTPREVREDIALARDIILSPDGVRDFRSWIGMFAEDVLRYDAGVLHKRLNRGGRICGLEVVSGPTIAPVRDGWGRKPTGIAPGYVQYVQGNPWKWLPADSLVYQPFREQPDSAYGWAPIESVLLSANTTMRIQTHWMNYFTEGNMPAGFATLPKEVTSPDQLTDWQEKYTAQYAGDDAARHQLRFLPNETQLFWPKDNKFDPEQAEFLMRITCAAYGVTPNQLGFTDDVNRSSGDNQDDVAFRIGTLPLLRYFEDILSSHLRKDRGLKVRFVFDTGQEAEERKQMADLWDKAVHNGSASSSEFRTNVLALEADENPIPRGVITPNGVFIPLEAMFQAAARAGDGEQAHEIGTKGAMATVITPEGGAAPAAATTPAGPGAAPDHPAPTGPVQKSLDTAVSDAASTIECAGLAIVAADTGRVLMIQRALEEGDPAGGTWEFPGGHLEDGETPLQGAVREWQEETGTLLPAGMEFLPVQDNGIYRLHAAVVAREDLVRVNTARAVINPDDPDGDCIEACAWWVPADAAANPALRPELAECPWELLADLAPGSMDGVAKTLTKWRQNALARLESGHAPRLFKDSGLPVSIETRVWKALRTAKTPDAVTQAFAQI